MPNLKPLIFYPAFCATVTVTLVLSGCAPQSSGTQIQVDDRLNWVSEQMKQSQNLESARHLQRDYYDMMRTLSENKIGLPDGLTQDQNLTQVTADYGQSVIDLHALPLRTGSDTGVRPWSSWWFPKSERTLFDEGGSDSPKSPLGKYDLYRRKKWESGSKDKSAPGSSVDFEKQNYKPRSASWEGLCDAWAFASVLAPEPKRPVSKTFRKNAFSQTTIDFSVGDLKGLLLKTYEAITSDGLKYYGQKFTGNYDGWIYPDILPDQFHRFIEKQIFENKRPFVMDHEAGVEIWNVPVYRASYTMEAVPDHPDSVYVRLWLHTAGYSQSDEKDFVGSKEYIREYHYILTGQTDEEGKLHVNSGYWIKGPNGVDSRRDHPDYVIEISDPEKITRKSWNPEVDPAIVDELLHDSI